MQQLINKTAITVNYPINVRSLSDRSEMGGLLHLATSLYHKIIETTRYPTKINPPHSHSHLPLPPAAPVPEAQPKSNQSDQKYPTGISKLLW